MFTRIWKGMIGGLALACAMPSPAQTPLDRVDPSLIEKDLRKPEKPPLQPRKPLRIERGISAGQIGVAVTVGAILVEGATQLPPSAFAPAIEKYVGRHLTPAELQSLAGDVAQVARDAGYGLATAGIPRQRVAGGILRVALDEGRIDEVQVEGTASAPVKRLLGPLADGSPVRTARLERQLLLLGELPGIRIGQARIDRRGDRNLLRIRADRDRIEGRVYLDNWGSEAVGPVRAQMIGHINGLLADDDQLTVGAVMTPFDLKEFALARAGYSKLVGTAGTEVSAYGYIARSEVGEQLTEIGGDSAEVSVAVSQPFRRSRELSVGGEIKFSLRDAEQDGRGVRLREDRLATLTASALAYGTPGAGRGSLRLSLVQGLDVLGATEEGDLLSSRRDGSGSFTKLEFWGSYDHPLGRHVSIRLQAEGQAASRALLVSEEMGLGGRYMLRGYDYRERSGDNGIAGSGEIRFDLADQPKPIKAVQLYLFADGGVVDNYNQGFGDGSLASAGGGIRVSAGKFDGSVEIGFPLKDRLGGSHSPRLSFTLGARF
jgi:hemolysin activation/secretion protein